MEAAEIEWNPNNCIQLAITVQLDSERAGLSYFFVHDVSGHF